MTRPKTLSVASLQRHCRQVLQRAIETPETATGPYGEYVSCHVSPGEKTLPETFMRHTAQTAELLEAILTQLTGGKKIYRVRAMYDWSDEKGPCRFEFSANPLTHDNVTADISGFLEKQRHQIELELDRHTRENASGIRTGK